MIRVGIVAVMVLGAIAYVIFSEFDSEVDNHDYKRPVVLSDEGECVETTLATSPKVVPIVTLGEPEIH